MNRDNEVEYYRSEVREFEQQVYELIEENVALRARVEELENACRDRAPICKGCKVFAAAERKHLTDRATRAEAQVEEFRVLVDDAHAEQARLFARATRAEAELAEKRDVIAGLIVARDKYHRALDKLRGALDKYGVHTQECASMVPRFSDPLPCNCGLDAALAECGRGDGYEV